ncbi:unnamed protein product, partial [Amoebophrya sp. A25]|eukprot:GSA25T00020627001.1
MSNDSSLPNDSSPPSSRGSSTSSSQHHLVFRAFNAAGECVPLEFGEWRVVKNG